MATILMVEDDPIQLYLYVEVLSPDCHVLIAQSVSEAIKVLANEHVDAIGCDFYLNDGCGLEVVEWIDEHRPELLACTVLITGELLPLRSRNDVHWLYKPVPIDALLDVFHTCLTTGQASKHGK